MNQENKQKSIGRAAAEEQMNNVVLKTVLETDQSVIQKIPRSVATLPSGQKELQNTCFRGPPAGRVSLPALLERVDVMAELQRRPQFQTHSSACGPSVAGSASLTNCITSSMDQDEGLLQCILGRLRSAAAGSGPVVELAAEQREICSDAKFCICRYKQSQSNSVWRRSSAQALHCRTHRPHPHTTIRRFTRSAAKTQGGIDWKENGMEREMEGQRWRGRRGEEEMETKRGSVNRKKRLDLSPPARLGHKALLLEMQPLPLCLSSRTHPKAGEVAPPRGRSRPEEVSPLHTERAEPGPDTARQVTAYLLRDVDRLAPESVERNQRWRPLGASAAVSRRLYALHTTQTSLETEPRSYNLSLTQKNLSRNVYFAVRKNALKPAESSSVRVLQQLPARIIGLDNNLINPPTTTTTRVSCTSDHFSSPSLALQAPQQNFGLIGAVQTSLDRLLQDQIHCLRSKVIRKPLHLLPVQHQGQHLRAGDNSVPATSPSLPVDTTDDAEAKGVSPSLAPPASSPSRLAVEAAKAFRRAMVSLLGLLPLMPFLTGRGGRGEGRRYTDEMLRRGLGFGDEREGAGTSLGRVTVKWKEGERRVPFILPFDRNFCIALKETTAAREREGDSLTAVPGRLQAVFGEAAPSHRKDVSGIISAPVVEGPSPAIERDKQLLSLYLGNSCRADQVRVLPVHRLQLLAGRNIGQDEAFIRKPEKTQGTTSEDNNVPIGWMSAESTSRQKSLVLSLPSNRRRSLTPIRPITVAMQVDVEFRGSLASSFIPTLKSLEGGIRDWEMRARH
ncbi:hypothetical protein DNTS_017906 [Danionella cerebrum]|uniref:Uncharacterized protein n=1 Tax=Danionella cerebrum TaxID=2873325 RepID=A0A553MSA6_9TELE|nr:hypothetical protein DNTS_017906 [Danionella translucida]